MVYTTEPNTPPVPTPPNVPNAMIWRFVRLDTDDQVCVKFLYGGAMGIQPPGSPAWVALGAKIASGEATPEDEAAYIEWWNVRTEYVFENADSLVVVLPQCPPVVPNPE